jgi:replication initiation protein RepC
VDAKTSSTQNENTNSRVPDPLRLGIILKTCPEFTQIALHLGTTLNDWNQMHRIAGKIRPMIGMTEQAWSHAQEKLGFREATAAMALIFEKFSKGDLKSPGGYLRGMVNKAEKGALHLERSFYKRLRQLETPRPCHAN